MKRRVRNGFRQSATEAGLAVYWTGLRCKKCGNLAPRRCCDGKCIPCQKARQKLAKQKLRQANGIQPRKISSPEAKRLNQRMSEAIRASLKARGTNKNGYSWRDLVGYSTENLKNHLERQFLKGMSWKNYGTHWHIDHRVPLSSFVFTNQNDSSFKAAWALSNLQPLWAEDNIKKGGTRIYLL